MGKYNVQVIEEWGKMETIKANGTILDVLKAKEELEQDCLGGELLKIKLKVTNTDDNYTLAKTYTKNDAYKYNMMKPQKVEEGEDCKVLVIEKLARVCDGIEAESEEDALNKVRESYYEVGLNARDLLQTVFRIRDGENIITLEDNGWVG